MLPVIIGLVALSSINKIEYGTFAPSLAGGVALVGHVAPLLEAGDGKGTPHEQLINTIVVRAAPFTTALPTAAWPGPYSYEASKITGRMTWLGYEEAARDLERRLSRRPRFAEVAAALGEVSWIAIKARPPAYAKLATATYYGLWGYLFTGEDARWSHAAASNYNYSRSVMNRSISLGYLNLNWAHWPQEVPQNRRGLFERFTDTGYYHDAKVKARYQERNPRVSYPDRWWGFVAGNKQWLAPAALLLSLLSIALLASKRRQDNALRFCAYAAILLHANMLLIAASHSAIFRYTLQLYPLIIPLVLGIAFVLARRLPRLGGRFTPRRNGRETLPPPLNRATGGQGALFRVTISAGSTIDGDAMTPEQYCKDKAAASGSSFYYSFLFLPAGTRRAITALYAFCREVDDIVDEAAEPMVARQKLDWWQQEIARVFAGRASHPVGRELQRLTGARHLRQQYFDDILHGMRMDLTQTRYADMAALERYCYHAAGAVGLLAIAVFGYRDRATERYARDLGQALQLTNIIRDVREDARRGRVYVPGELLTAHRVDEAALLRGEDSPPLRAALRALGERAEACYQAADHALPPAERWRQRSGLIMGEIYHALLERMAKKDYDVMSGRVAVPMMSKLWLAWRTARREAATRRRFAAT